MDYIGIVAIVAVITAVITYFIVKAGLNRANAAKVDEISRKAELEIEKAKLSAQRILDEADSKAEKIISQAESKSEKLFAQAESKSDKLIAQAEAKHENIKQEKIHQAKEKYAQLKAQFEEDKAQQRIALKEKQSEISDSEKAIERRTKELAQQKDALHQQSSELKSERDNISKQAKALRNKKREVDELNNQRIMKLEKIGGMSESEARKELLDAVKAKAETDAMSIIKDTISEAEAIANRKARKIIIQSIQRMCAEITIENTVTVFNLDSDDVKGQIIGREGRNIRALEAQTGAEIVVDDTPETVIISSFDPIRREVCRLALKRLVADGRIHPASIEEVVQKVKDELNEQIVEIGERTVIELNIHGLKPYLVKMVGRMRFRSSYGQNLLKHSIETANLCAIMAAELGLSPKQAELAKRAGLLHDIGKVSEEDIELSHALIGKKLTEKYGEDPIVINAVGAHHDEIEMNNIISPIVQACDAISGARPGARREIMESYMKRIVELEELAMGYEGVQKAYAMQAGRELRVMVESDKVSDKHADDLAFMISQKIQDQLKYPGQVNVLVIREKRSKAIAR